MYISLMWQHNVANLFQKIVVCTSVLYRFRYSSLGEVQKPPFFKNGYLQIEYQDGALCKNKNIKTPHIKTTIRFICVLEATV